MKPETHSENVFVTHLTPCDGHRTFVGHPSASFVHSFDSASTDPPLHPPLMSSNDRSNIGRCHQNYAYQYYSRSPKRFHRSDPSANCRSNCTKNNRRYLHHDDHHNVLRQDRTPPLLDLSCKRFVAGKPDAVHNCRRQPAMFWHKNLNDTWRACVWVCVFVSAKVYVVENSQRMRFWSLNFPVMRMSVIVECACELCGERINATVYKRYRFIICLVKRPKLLRNTTIGNVWVLKNKLQMHTIPRTI